MYWLSLLEVPLHRAVSVCKGSVKFHLILVRVGLLCLSFDLAEPNNLTQNTARKIQFPMVRGAEGISSSGWLDLGWGTLQGFLYLFYNPSLSKLNCKGLILVVFFLWSQKDACHQLRCKQQGAQCQWWNPNPGELYVVDCSCQHSLRPHVWHMLPW